MQVLGNQSKAAPTESHLRVGDELNRGSHNDAAFLNRERRNVGPPAGEVESYRRRGFELRSTVRLPAHRSTHQSCTVGSSPRRSMVTPWSLRFIPWSPRE